MELLSEVMKLGIFVKVLGCSVGLSPHGVLTGITEAMGASSIESYWGYRRDVCTLIFSHEDLMWPDAAERVADCLRQNRRATVSIRSYIAESVFKGVGCLSRVARQQHASAQHCPAGDF